MDHDLGAGVQSLCITVLPSKGVKKEREEDSSPKA